jgi:hypothetical protein
MDEFTPPLQLLGDTIANHRLHFNASACNTQAASNPHQPMLLKESYLHISLGRPTAVAPHLSLQETLSWSANDIRYEVRGARAQAL